MDNQFAAKVTAEVINKQLERLIDCIFLKDVEKDTKKMLRKKIKEYIESKILEFSYLIPLALDKQIKLKKLYYPLTLSYISESNDSIKIDKFKIEIFEKSSRIIIEDSAGMGKTTLLRYMYLDFLEQNHNYIPIFLELRLLNDEIDLEENILNVLKIDELHKEEVLKKDFLIFLDGFDEVKNKEKILKMIKDFSNFNNNNLYIITTRKEHSLNSLSNYIKMKILELEANSGVLLLKNYIQDLDFFSQLEKEKNELKDFLSTPLLATLIYKAYKHGKSIPKTKSALYEQVYEALYSDHDIRSKNGFKREIVLNKSNFQKLLAYFSFDNFNKIKNANGEFKKLDLISKFSKINEKLNYNIDLEELIMNLIKEVPLFLEVGTEYSWKHKSMQEFFIAIYIIYYSNDKEKYIEALMKSKARESYLNILEFIYSYDNTLYKKILYKVLLGEKDNRKDYEIKVLKTDSSHYGKNFYDIFEYSSDVAAAFVMATREDGIDLTYSMENFKYTDLLMIILKKEYVPLVIPIKLKEETKEDVEQKILKQFIKNNSSLISIKYHEELFKEIIVAGILEELNFEDSCFKNNKLNFAFISDEYSKLCKQDEEKGNIENFIFNNL